MRVAIIGAGPSGIVTLKYLLQAEKQLSSEPVEARLFETEATVGGTFAKRTYEDAELVSSAQLTTFSDFRPRKDDPDYLSAPRYLEYLNEYCDHFGLWPHIRLNTRLVSVRRRTSEKTGDGHIVRYRDEITGKETEWECDAVAVCSGLHVTPNIPKLEGIENVPKVLHSSDFKTRSQFGKDTTVVVLGTGETGMDIGHLAVTSPTKRVVMCHRDGFLCAAKRVPDPVFLPILGGKPKPPSTDPKQLLVPTDCSTASLFETAYTHPWLRKNNSWLLWAWYDNFVKNSLWLISGTKHGIGEWAGGISDENYHVSKVFFNKSTRALPYISAPYAAEASSTIVQRIRSALIQVPIAPTNGRHIDLAPWPSHIDATGAVHFRNDGRKEYRRMKKLEKEIGPVVPDVLIMATGYTQTFPFFPPSISADAEKSRRPYPTASEADVRYVWRRGNADISFIGFVRPSFGAIPPQAELQAQLWVLRLLGDPATASRLDNLDPSDESFYALQPPSGYRIDYGVDHESYAYQLALDMQSAPGFWEVIHRGWRVSGSGKGKLQSAWYKLPLTWALGANFNVKFRLRGPWRWDGAEEVLVEELWGTIERRGGFFGLLMLSFIPIVVLGSVSICLWICSTVTDGVAWLARGGRKQDRRVML